MPASCVTSLNLYSKYSILVLLNLNPLDSNLLLTPQRVSSIKTIQLDLESIISPSQRFLLRRLLWTFTSQLIHLIVTFESVVLSSSTMSIWECESQCLFTLQCNFKILLLFYPLMLAVMLKHKNGCSNGLPRDVNELLEGKKLK